MDKKKLCVEILSDLFGPSTGRMIESSTDDDTAIVEKCTAKISAFFGAERAALFADYIQTPTADKKAKILVK